MVWRPLAVATTRSNNTDTFAGKLLDKVVGGWVAAGYTTLRSGQPLGVNGSNTLWWIAGQANNGTSERPSFVYPRVPFNNNFSGHAALIGSAASSPYMNRSSFRLAEATPSLLEIGDTGPVIPGLIGPAFSQWDFSLMKNFALGRNESRYFQLRLEAQNVRQFSYLDAEWRCLPGMEQHAEEHRRKLLRLSVFNL